jgi:hypothetical protein
MQDLRFGVLDPEDGTDLSTKTYSGLHCLISPKTELFITTAAII